MVAVTIKIKNSIHSIRTTGAARGSYVLMMSLAEERTIRVGGLGAIHFASGNYAYVGSALGGLEARLNRHLRTDKKYHWHIDYLLKEAVPDAVITGETLEKTECAISYELARRFDSVPDFGSSDCHCHSHLFFGTDEMASAIISAFEGIGLEPEVKYLREQS
jgi:Uri superfamily endonuclease